MILQSPFAYFGGKSAVADAVWQRFGNVPNYVEPFFGSGAVLLRRPHDPGIETVNDVDGMVCNFWRAVKHDPDAVAMHADYPAIESDLHARHAWLVGQKASLAELLEGDPDAYDAKIAGWWVWGMALWIGGGFCSGEGPWVHEDGRLVKREASGHGVQKQLLHLTHSGRGVQKQLLHLSDAGQGVKKQGDIYTWMNQLSHRLRKTRVCCGDWTRIMGPSSTVSNGITGVFLDPPYGVEATREKVYSHDSETVAEDVRAWCMENGSNPMLRIALCGYTGEHESLQDQGWTSHYWKTGGGYGNQGTGRGKANAAREVIWFSPHCLDARQGTLF